MRGILASLAASALAMSAGLGVGGAGWGGGVATATGWGWVGGGAGAVAWVALAIFGLCSPVFFAVPAEALRGGLGFSAVAAEGGVEAGVSTGV